MSSTIAPTRRRRVRAFLSGLLSFRVLLALTTSVSVTGVVAGPMAYQAAKARASAADEVVASGRPGTGASRPGPSRGPVATSPTPTTAPADPSTTDAPTSTSDASPASPGSTTSAEPADATTTATPGPTVAGPAVPSATTPVPALTATGLFMSVFSDHASPVALDGGVARYTTWIFVDAPEVRSVRFWVDDPTGAGPPVRTASVPFDLAPDGIDLRLTYGLGRHTVLAEVTTIDGTYRRLASFEIAG